MINRQDVFNKIKNHLLSQDKRSVIDKGTRRLCAYRGDNDLSCAIGCLIPDTMYYEDLEGMGVCDEPVLVILKTCKIPTDDKSLNLLNHLQEMHDGDPPAQWENSLKRIATQYGLIYETK